MAFVNEYMPESDIVKYDIANIDRRYFKGTFDPDWTVDRGRDIYLRLVKEGREEFSNHKTYTLYWKGALVEVHLLLEIVPGPEGVIVSEYTLQKIQIPDQLADHYSEILCDLKDALTTYGGGGVYASNGAYIATFTF